MPVCVIPSVWDRLTKLEAAHATDFADIGSEFTCMNCSLVSVCSR